MDLFGISGVPYMARRNYLIELQHLVLWGVFAGMFEGTVSSIVAAKTFHASPWLITLVMATPMAANLMGLVWGTVATGRRKLPLFLSLGMATTAMVASVGLTPTGHWGAWIFAGQVFLSRVFLAGCVTLRASLWKHNYPQGVRGRLAARLQVVRFSFGISTVVFVSTIFDLSPTAYVYVYPLAGLIGGAALLLLRRMHVRGEVVELAEIHRGENGGCRMSDVGCNKIQSTSHPTSDIPHPTSDIPRPTSGILTLRGMLGPMIDALRRDRPWARYCASMMLLGSANIMLMPIITIIVTKELYLTYFHSCNLIEVLPRVLMMGTMIAWAGLFDRIGAVQFRVWNGLMWMGVIIFCGLAAAVMKWGGTATDPNPGMDTVGRFVAIMCLMGAALFSSGLAQSGGAIAWNLGHLHFAEPMQAEIYMGTHVFFTGIRGLVAPFLGTFLYSHFWPAAFVIPLLLSWAGLWGFKALATREIEAERSDAISEAAAAPPEVEPATAAAPLS